MQSVWQEITAYFQAAGPALCVFKFRQPGEKQAKNSVKFCKIFTHTRAHFEGPARQHNKQALKSWQIQAAGGESMNENVSRDKDTSSWLLRPSQLNKQRDGQSAAKMACYAQDIA